MPLRQIKVGDLAACLMPKLLLALILAWWVAPAAAAENDEAIRAFVEKVNEASLGFFASGSEADARERCRALLALAFDVDRHGQGSAWPGLGQGDCKRSVMVLNMLLMAVSRRTS